VPTEYKGMNKSRGAKTRETNKKETTDKIMNTGKANNSDATMKSETRK